MLLTDYFGKILEFAYENNASDIHMDTGQCAVFRINGQLIRDTSLDKVFSKNEIFSIVAVYKTVLDIDKIESCDFSFNKKISERYVRFRANLYSTLDGFSLAIRVFPSIIPTLGDLHAPNSVMQLSSSPHGLVLVSGPTGSGKSTTLAAMLDHINSNKAMHIITIEDPVEYIHYNKQSVIVHREVGTNCQSFYSGFKAALREDPDIILLGEIRDMDTMKLAMEAAESGHLVISTFHSSTVIECLNRIIGMFPPEACGVVANQLSISLTGVVAQKLLPSRKGGRIAAYEVLVNNPTIANVIKNNNMKHLVDYMRPVHGMITFSEYISGLKNKRLID